MIGFVRFSVIANTRFILSSRSTLARCRSSFIGPGRKRFDPSRSALGSLTPAIAKIPIPRFLKIVSKYISLRSFHLAVANGLASISAEIIITITSTLVKADRLCCLLVGRSCVENSRCSMKARIAYKTIFKTPHFTFPTADGAFASRDGT